MPQSRLALPRLALCATCIATALGGQRPGVCFTMLHHLPSAAAQDRLYAEAGRVLRPNGRLAGSDSRWGPLFALAHIGDTCTLVDPEALPARLEVAGFDHVEIDTRRDAFRFQAHVD